MWGKQLIELDVLDTHVVQDVSGKGLELLRRFDQPLGTVLGLTSNTRAVPRMPSPSARHATTHTMSSTETRLPWKRVPRGSRKER
jgi:hypothetical protein